MNIQYSDWQSINLNQVQSAFDAGLNEFFNTYNANFDPLGSTVLNTIVDTNIRTAGTTLSGFNFDVRGNHFLDDVPFAVFNYIGLSNISSNLLITGNLIYNYDAFNNNYSGYYDKFSYTSTISNTNLLLLGRVNIGGNGNITNGTQTQVSVSSGGYTESYAGNIILNANSDISAAL